MKWRRWIQILTGFSILTMGTVWQTTTCAIRLPNTVNVNPPPFFIGGAPVDHDGCEGFCVGDFDD
jgi:hypothetical protein